MRAFFPSLHLCDCALAVAMVAQEQYYYYIIIQMMQVSFLVICCRSNTVMLSFDGAVLQIFCIFVTQSINIFTGSFITDFHSNNNSEI